MWPILIVLVLLLLVPLRLSKGFPALSRLLIVSIVVAKTVLLIVLHMQLVRSTGFPIILDSSTDEKGYYDFGEAFTNQHLLDITLDDLIRERQANSHLGYFVVNVLAFKACPDDPMLFLRLCKLLLFHIGLGMLANTWRVQTNATRAMAAYTILGLVYFEFFYYTFRDLKDDMLLSLFMMIMAIMERSAFEHEIKKKVSLTMTLARWTVVGALTFLTATIRFYLGFAYVCCFGLHIFTGRGLKVVYRIMLAGLVVAAFMAFTATSGYQMVEERGGGEAVVESAGNVFGLFKIFVRPFPWQHAIPYLGISHTFYLLAIPVILWAFISRIHKNMDWKFYLVGLLALVLGGLMGDFETRKRFVMYPVFAGWVVAMGRREESTAAATEPFDPNAYFARRQNVLT